ncbi:MAG: BlaR1 family beta-lactam sensor/signal transducer, partial [Coprobacillaceae bacterium]
MIARFLLSNIVSILILLMIIIIKKILNKQLTIKYHYWIWYAFILSLCLFLIPNIVIKDISMLSTFESALLNNNQSTLNTTQTIYENTGLINDITTTVNKADFTYIINIFYVVYGIGIALAIGHAFQRIIDLNRTRRKSNNPDQDIYALFEDCKRKLEIQTTVELYILDENISPYSYGIFRKKIVLPKTIMSKESSKDIEYILLHELMHIKHHDAFRNIIFSILKIIYWINPFIYKAFQKITNDNELYCDDCVISYLNQEERIAYGHTILNVSEVLYYHKNIFTNNFGSNKKLIKQRITNVIDFSFSTTKQRRISLISIMIVIGITCCQLPILSMAAQDLNSYYNNHIENINQLDLDSYFQDVEGTFVLLDSNNTYSIYNEDLARERVSPNSTYKIADALIALENNIITNEQNELSWNGTEYPFDSWNQDQNLLSAMTNSTTWYFQNLDKQLGKGVVNNYLTKMNYGNQNITASLDSYYLESSLEISAIEQVQFLKNMNENVFDFDL